MFKPITIIVYRKRKTGTVVYFGPIQICVNNNVLTRSGWVKRVWSGSKPITRDLEII